MQQTLTQKLHPLCKHHRTVDVTSVADQHRLLMCLLCGATIAGPRLDIQTTTMPDYSEKR